MVNENESLGFGSFKAGDIVWAKAFPHMWWPGWIRRSGRVRVLVFLFGSNRTGCFKESEICSFEDNFDTLSKEFGWKDSGVLDCALVAFGCGVALGLMCPCQISVEVGKGGNLKDNVDVKKAFQPVVILGFVLSMAVLPMIEDADAVIATKVVAQVKTFRHFVSVDRSRIYQETIRFSGCRFTSDDSEAIMRSEKYAREERTLRGIGFEGYTHTHTSSGSNSRASLEIMEQLGDDIAFTCRERKVNNSLTNLASLFSEHLNRTSPSMDVHGPATSLLRTYHEESNLPTFSSMNPSVMSRDQKCLSKHGNTQSVAKILGHLHCLALDPFYLGNGSSKILQRIFLKHRFLSYWNNLNLSSTSYSLRNCNESLVLSESGDGTNVHIEPSNEVDTAATVIDDKRDGELIDSLRLSKECPGDYSTLKRRLDLPSVLDCSCKLQKTQPLVQVSIANTYLQGKRTSGVSYLSDDFSTEPLVKCYIQDYEHEECKIESLHELLTHLHWLALDPFYFGAENSKSVCKNLLNPLYSEAESLASVFWKILNYRDLVYQNVLDLPPVEHLSGCGKMFEINKGKGLDSLSHLPKVAAKTELKENIGVVNDDWSYLSHVREESIKVQPTDKITVGGRMKQVEIDCNLSLMQQTSVAETVFKDAVETLDNRASDASGEELLSSHLTDDHIKVLPCSDGGSTSTITCRKVDLEKDSGDKSDRERKLHRYGAFDFSCKSQATQQCSPVTRVHESPLPVNGYVSTSNIRCHYSGNSGRCVLPTALRMKSVKEFDLPSMDASVVELRQHQQWIPLNRLYASPLSTANLQSQFLEPNRTFLVPTSLRMKSPKDFIIPCKDELAMELGQPSDSDFSLKSDIAKCQFSQKGLHARSLPMSSSMVPVSLHMKFPKGFNLPSRNELVKKFSRFGKVDYSKSTIYFYTGSAKVVFLRHLDALAAYHYAKGKRNLFARANVHFWLDPFEHKRRATINSPVQIPLSIVRPPGLNLKSCLKTSSTHDGKDGRKFHRVRFLTQGETFSVSGSPHRFRSGGNPEISSSVGSFG